MTAWIRLYADRLIGIAEGIATILVLWLIGGLDLDTWRIWFCFGALLIVELVALVARWAVEKE